MCKCSGKCGCNITSTTKGEKGDSGNTSVLTTKVTLTTAQILALFTTPIQLVATPGVNLAIQVIKSSARINYNTVPYATNLVLGIGSPTASVSQETITGLLGASITKIQNGLAIGSTASETQLISNAAVNVSALVGNPTAGNSSVDIYLTYRIIAL